MAVTNPPGYLQNAGATHTSQLLRTTLGGLTNGVTAVNSMKAAGGVHPYLGFQLAVQQNGAPNMTVNVLSGVAYVPGTQDVNQGLYACPAYTTTNLAIAAAHATLPRIDIVVAQVEDSQYSGAVNAWKLAVVTGTAAGSPAAPAAPNNSLVLANIAVAAAVTSIVTANITDKRTWASALNAPIPCTSTTRPVAIKGLTAYETDTDSWIRHDGTNWRLEQKTLRSKIFTSSTGNVVGGTELDISGMTLTNVTLRNGRRYRVHGEFAMSFVMTAGESFSITARQGTATPTGTVLAKHNEVNRGGSADDVAHFSLIFDWATADVVNTSIFLSLKRESGGGSLGMYASPYHSAWQIDELQFTAIA